MSQDQPAPALYQIDRAGHQPLAALQSLFDFRQLCRVLAIVQPQHAAIGLIGVDDGNNEVRGHGEVDDIWVLGHELCRAGAEFGLGDRRVLADDGGQFAEFQDLLEDIRADPFADFDQLQGGVELQILHVGLVGQRLDPMAKAKDNGAERDQHDNPFRTLRQRISDLFHAGFAQSGPCPPRSGLLRAGYAPRTLDRTVLC